MREESSNPWNEDTDYIISFRVKIYSITFNIFFIHQFL